MSKQNNKLGNKLIIKTSTRFKHQEAPSNFFFKTISKTMEDICKSCRQTTLSSSPHEECSTGKPKLS